MPKLNDMMPSKYLKAADCEDQDLVVTISHVAEETVGQGAQSEKKWILYFSETEKGLVLNKTNMKSIGDLHGDDTDEWEGKKIALFATEVSFQGDMVMAIRVRKKAPKGKQGKATVPAAEAEDNTPSEDAPF